MSKIVGKKDNISFKDSYSIFGPVKDEHNFQIGLYLMLQCQSEIYQGLMSQKGIKSALEHYAINIDLPHQIRDDNLDELPIFPLKVSNNVNKWDRWTEVCKYYLTNM